MTEGGGPVGFAMSEDLVRPGRHDEVREMHGLPVVNELWLPRNSVYLVVEGGGVPA